MTALDRLIPSPRMLEIDRVDLAAPAARVWERVRHGDLPHSPLIRALFAVRTLWGHDRAPSTLRLDKMTSSAERPGFQLLVDDVPHEVAVAAIGKVWRLDIPFVHVGSTDEYAEFKERGFIKVAWAIRVSPCSEHETHVEFELRVDATDDESWRKFRRYFRLIGVGSRFIRRSMLHTLARELGAGTHKNERPLPGDELLPGATGQTHFIDIVAPPEAIWPWLLQMGSRRAGFYSIDLLDNAGVRSAREIHPQWQRLDVGDVIPATPGGDEDSRFFASKPRAYSCSAASTMPASANSFPSRRGARSATGTSHGRSSSKRSTSEARACTPAPEWLSLQAVACMSRGFVRCII